MEIFNARLGDVVRIGKAPTWILVTDATGTLINPTTIAVAIHRPDGSVQNGTPGHVLDGASAPIVGTFFYDYEPPATAAMAGRHYVRIVTTAPDAEYELTLYFSPSRFIA